MFASVYRKIKIHGPAIPSRTRAALSLDLGPHATPPLNPEGKAAPSCHWRHHRGGDGVGGCWKGEKRVREREV